MTELSDSPVSRRVRAHVPHGVTPKLIVTIYPNGTIGLRENRRRMNSECILDAGTLYVSALRAKVRAARAERKAARKGRR